MPQSATGLDHREDSPSSQPETAPVSTQPTQPVDTGAVVADRSEPDSPIAQGGESPKDDRSRDEQGRFAPKDGSKPATPDPVKDAIERLVKKSIPDAPNQPGKADADPPKDASKAPEVKPTDEDLKTRTKDDLDAPPEMRARWKKDTTEQFDKLRSIAHASQDELKKAAPLIEQGRNYSKVLDDFELHTDIGFVPPEHFAGVVKAQAAINRALIAIDQGRTPAPSDIETVTTLAATVDSIRSQLGIQTTAPPPTSSTSKPFTGELPQDLKDMVEIYGFDEKRARQLAALEAGAAAPTPTKPTERHIEQPPASRPAKPVGVDMDLLYGRKLLSEMHADGVADPRKSLKDLLQHQQTRQEIIRRFPGTPIGDVPDVFDSLDAATRYEILKSAHTALQAKQAPTPSRSNNLPPPTTNRGVPTTTVQRREAPANGQDAVSAAIAHLARE